MEKTASMLFLCGISDFQKEGSLLVKKASAYTEAKIMASGNEKCLFEYLKGKNGRHLSDTECSHLHRTYNLYLLDDNEEFDKETFEISSYEGDDREQIISLACLMYRQTEGGELKRELAEKFEENNGNSIFVIRNGKDICAMARVIYSNYEYARINTVVVNENYRGHGYAKAIVRALCRDIRDKGKIPTVLADSLNPITNHIYSSLGLRKTARLYEYIFDDSICENALLSGFLS